MKKDEAGQVTSATMLTAADGTDFTDPVTVYITGDGGLQTIGSVDAGGGAIWSKQGMVLDLGAGGQWDDADVHSPSVILDGATYKMWYVGYDGSDYRIGYATSADGITWAKQGMVLDLGAGGEWDDFLLHSPTVILDGATYKMWYTGHDGASFSIGYATSADGITWAKQGMVLDVGAGGEWDDDGVQSPSVILDGATYKMWYGGDDGTKLSIGYATSADGITWAKQGMVLDVGAVDEWDDDNVNSPSVILDGATYKMWYGGDDGASFSIGYATSADGITWSKQGMVLDLGAGGEWDDVQVNIPAVILDGTTYKVWYTGNDGTNLRIGYATSAGGAGLCLYKGNGEHEYTPAQAETNYNQVKYTYIGTGAITVGQRYETGFPQSVDNDTKISAAALEANVELHVSNAINNTIPLYERTDGTLPADGTEQIIYEVTPSVTITPDSITMSLANMVANDRTIIRMYAKMKSGGSYELIDSQVYTDDKTIPAINITGQPNRYGWKVTLEQTAGVDKNYDWERYTLTT